MHLRHIIAIIALLAVGTLNTSAQTDDQYRMEIGAGIGLLTYEGDFNGSITAHAQPAVTLMLRRVVNPYMGFRLAATYGKMKGSSANVKTYYPQYATEPFTFDRSLVDVSLTYEYNFWPYGTGHDYRGAKRFTPFVFGGIGATAAWGEPKGNNAFTANIPLGLGVKYKAGKRLNVGLEWAMHFSLSDKLDACKDPYTISSSGAFKNTDCYSMLQLSVTYSFSPKCKTCHNDDE